MLLFPEEAPGWGAGSALQTMTLFWGVRGVGGGMARNKSRRPSRIDNNCGILDGAGNCHLQDMLLYILFSRQHRQGKINDLYLSHVHEIENVKMLALILILKVSPCLLREMTQSLSQLCCLLEC